MKKITCCFVLVLLTGQSCLPRATADIISYSTSGSIYGQDFNTLPTTGNTNWTNDVTIPGWVANRTGNGTTIIASNGSANGGGLYSYGTGTNADRALGSLGSGNAAAGSFAWGVGLRNDTGSVLNSLNLSFTGEQWRNSAAAAQSIEFSFRIGSGLTLNSFGPVTDNVGWNSASALNFTSPITGGTAGALDGNAAANRSFLSSTISAVWNPGDVLLLRWRDIDHTGTDHGLSIDDVSFSAVPEPASMLLLGVAGIGGLALRRFRFKSVKGEAVAS